MALPSFLKRKDSTTEPAASLDAGLDDGGPVQVARARARRRLIGAVVLLAIGVIGFPMLFETQPRPLPNNIPIELPRREGAAPRPSALPYGTPAVSELPPVAETAAAAAVPTPAPAASEAVAAVAPPTVDSQVAAVKPAPAPTSPVAAPAAPSESKPAAVKPEDIRKADSERARALLEGRAEPAAKAALPASTALDPKAGRFVVQVGAYTDANTLRDVRSKVEKLGLKTYTQSVDTDAGKRTRVRVGPFATRQEAESASDRLKAAGLPGNVLTL